LNGKGKYLRQPRASPRHGITANSGKGGVFGGPPAGPYKKEKRGEEGRKREPQNSMGSVREQRSAEGVSKKRDAQG